MSECMMSTLLPIWIGIAFNVTLTFINLFCAGMNGRLINWYFEGNGGAKLMIAVWSVLVLWAITAGVTQCR